MRMRPLCLALVGVLALSACGSKEETINDDITVSAARDGLPSGPLDGTEIFTGDGSTIGGVDSVGLGSGTQADFVANIGDRVFFDTDSSSINQTSRGTLSRQAEWLNQFPNAAVTVEGHADERGTREYNLALGERRASAVKNYLVNLGVDPRRVNTISYGKEQPSVLGANPSAWAQNRRGVTRVE